jgi:hypothetical protein
MNTNDILARQIGVARRYLDATLQNLTPEELNWTPPGLANGIGATLLHLLGGEDRVVQTVTVQIQGEKDEIRGCILEKVVYTTD